MRLFLGLLAWLQTNLGFLAISQYQLGSGDIMNLRGLHSCDLDQLRSKFTSHCGSTVYIEQKSPHPHTLKRVLSFGCFVIIIKNGRKQLSAPFTALQLCPT